MTSLTDHLAGWSPAPLVETDLLDPRGVADLSRVLGLDEPAAVEGGELPPLWHWLSFLDWPAPQRLGDDGHPRDGHFLPPIPERRRMIAGGRLELTAPLVVGRPTERTSSVENVAVKNGSTGEMAFVTVRYELRQDGELKAVEEHDVVYRSGDAPGRAALAAIDTEGVPDVAAPWRLDVATDPVLLFRFSALTHNSHRIHFDTAYVRDVEGYPDLVVHGPLLVLLMLELVRRDPARSVSSFAYRLRRPVYVGEALTIAGEPTDGGADLRVATARDDANATATVRFA